MPDPLKQRIADAAIVGAVREITQQLGQAFEVELIRHTTLEASVRVREAATRRPDGTYTTGPRYFAFRVSEPL